jgi:starch synthase (maltosyl-transferring)
MEHRTGDAPTTTPRARTQGRRPQIPRTLDGRRRAIVEDVTPEIDAGRFPIKRVVGERVVVEADAFADGHEIVACELRYRRAGDAGWQTAPMQDLGNDRRRGAFTVREQCPHEYTVVAWVDHFATWRRGLLRKAEAGQDVAVDLLIGAELILAAAGRGTGPEAARLTEIAGAVAGEAPAEERIALATGEETARLVAWFPDLAHATEHERVLRVWVDRPKGRTSTWYELFPRSLGAHEHRHGTLADVEARLDEIAAMGFDVLYLPPIHPIGVVNRKGRNNAVRAVPGDVGSPWAIGAREGGHDAVHPQLGTHDDVRRLAVAARARGIDLALDLALQCAPDHPWVAEHPGWFRSRPDGTVQYAENPPKKYEDIYPIDFETDDWQALWRALLGVVRVWIDCGVRVFRVDNPHTKPFAFWEWLIEQVHRDHPEVLFLAEAFTRPKVMRRLAKLGFTQSYTYFAWRNSRWELTEYFTELTRTEQREYFRPNVWPNTPDILTEYLQTGGRPAFVIRLVLAATLAASYGIYGPAFELAEARPREPGSEEYLDSEKYELRDWDHDSPWSLRDLVARVNGIRRDHPALHTDEHLAFHPTDNDALLCYSKRDPESGDTILAVITLDPFNTQSGWTSLDLDALGLDDGPYAAEDLLGGGRYTWEGPRNFVQLNPHELPAHVFALRGPARAGRETSTDA